MIKKWDRKTVLTLLYSFVALALAVTVCFLLVSKFSHKEQPIRVIKLKLTVAIRNGRLITKLLMVLFQQNLRQNGNQKERL